jgi:hypothetical protein
MTEWGIPRGVPRWRALVAVEEAELEAQDERERDEDDQRGCGEEGRAHGGSVAVLAMSVKAAEADVI